MGMRRGGRDSRGEGAGNGQMGRRGSGELIYGHCEHQTLYCAHRRADRSLNFTVRVDKRIMAGYSILSSPNHKIRRLARQARVAASRHL